MKQSTPARCGPALLYFQLPHPARRVAYHWFGLLAAKRLPELGEVFFHIVHPIFGERMRIGSDHCAGYLRTNIAAPSIGVRQEETLQVGPAIGAFLVERLTLLLVVVL